ncbi:chromate efflux transporter [Paenibacillus apiarius]|uniref:chromate efflux transporter n=1 Tax=Paenibacillus apiarius TaxID=46240 RepID=UPI00197CF6DB|nr:chromate efflux transporter [Paenibacillus apiarius]MBN3527451.1 chromate efflux transporter [Paenibacillus apiarius]
MPTVSRRVWDTFVAALHLGLTSFGGPIAHIGYFRKKYVEQLRWVNDNQFAELNALCQMLPGPSSSQLGIGIGMMRAGWLGGIAAWLGFTLPSACLLVAFALGLGRLPDVAPGWLQGLKLVAVPIICQALWGMSKQLTPDPARVTIAVAAAAGALFAPGMYGQLAIILISLIVGVLLFRERDDGVQHAHAAYPSQVSQQAARSHRMAALFLLAVFFALFLMLPWLKTVSFQVITQLSDIMYRTGALVFGGGHVVLPLLKEELAHAGWLNDSVLLAGYGAAQAVPGPLFTFAAFIGASLAPGWTGIGYACIATLFIFLPSYLLIGAALPYLERLRQWRGVRAALKGVNAAVVGLLLAALYNPVWVTSVHGPVHFTIILIGALLLITWKLPPWAVVAACAILGGWLL